MLFVLHATRRRRVASAGLRHSSSGADARNITMGLAPLFRFWFHFSMIQWRTGTFRLHLMKFQGIGKIRRCDKEVEIRSESKTYKII